MAFIRTWADTDRLDPPLSAAELQLVDDCCAGRPRILADEALLPDSSPDPDNAIRSDLLRYLILGGCDEKPVGAWGVRLHGAYITGALDLSFATAQGATSLIGCQFENRVIAVQSRLELLNLSASTLPGLTAQGAQIAGNVLLRDIKTSATIDLNGAAIGGQLSCRGAQFAISKGAALNVQRATIKGSLHLSRISTNATINLSGSHIGGQLDCESATVDAPGSVALKLNGMAVDEGFFFRNINHSAGTVDLTSAHVGDLVDDPQSWPAGGQVILDGFTYDRIGAFTDVTLRRRWLEAGDTWNGEFFPQPYTQLAKVLRSLGHERDARKVLMARERRLAQHERIRRRQNRADRPENYVAGLLGDAADALRWVWDGAKRIVVGYGHEPTRSLNMLAALWCAAVILSHNAWESGDFAPNSGPIQSTATWQDLAANVQNPAKVWSTRPRDETGARVGYAPGQDWETFNRYAYAADLVIPIIDLGQTDAWAPSTERGDWGRALVALGYLLQIAGWIVTALGAAAITGIIRRD